MKSVKKFRFHLNSPIAIKVKKMIGKMKNKFSNRALPPFKHIKSDSNEKMEDDEDNSEVKFENAENERIEQIDLLD